MKAFEALLKFARRRPFVFGVGLAGTKNAMCDVGVQSFIEGRRMPGAWGSDGKAGGGKGDGARREIDWRRTAVFGTFGLLFNGAWQYCLFVRIMPRWFPNAAEFAAKPLRQKVLDKVGMRNLFLQLGIENGINNPLIYFPLFYNVKEYIEGGTPKDAWEKLHRNYAEDVIAVWKLWIPAQLINFAFSPLWLRVPFVAGVSALWTSYISFVRGDPEEI